MAEQPAVTGWRADSDPVEALFAREWLVANGLGGYASGTLANINTRRYHGMLVAALSMPYGRMLMLKHLSERLVIGDQRIELTGQELHPPLTDRPHREYLTEFSLDSGLPVWHFRVNGIELEKRVVMIHQQNTACVLYRQLSGPEGVKLELRPSINFRPHEGRGGEPVPHYAFTIRGERYEVFASSRLPVLRFRLEGGGREFVADHTSQREVFFHAEAERGYDPRGVMWNPGYFRVALLPGREASLTASTEEWHAIEALRPRDILHYERQRRRTLLGRACPDCRTGPAAQLVFTADQFVVTPAGRLKDAVRAHAEGNEVRTVIAGYHWFTDWGRDTMISLEGLTLVTGRWHEAAWILRTFAAHLREGLIPNMFPEKGDDGRYNTADATLWYFHAIERYLALTGDRALLRELLPGLQEIFRFHLQGTRFGIRVDPEDGLLTQGLAGYQLTWMDAKVGEWVVTPRRGKAVEINALWYNALRLLAHWLREEAEEATAQPVDELAEQVRTSFNERFWFAEGGYLYDVVDGEEGEDTACRPNQILALSLAYPVLMQERWQPVLEVVRERLLTPFGLRTLAPGHPDYKPRYFGDLHARDAAYHQGTVWPWLIGPFIDACLRVHPEDRDGARRLLDRLWDHINDAGVGSVSEIFDAEPPYAPRGCISQAWSVAEMLRCWIKTGGDN